MDIRKEIEANSRILQSLQVPQGLLLAAPARGTGYNKAWIRDNVYETLGLEVADPKRALRAIHGIFEILKKHEGKIDCAINEKPRHAYQYIHARYNPETLKSSGMSGGTSRMMLLAHSFSGPQK